MTVSYKDYNEEKRKFFEKHKNDFKCNTSSMDEYGRYWKDYIFSDGAVWYEAMCSEYVRETVEVKKVNVTVEVKMLRTEFWSSECGSKYYYEKF